MSPKEGNNNQKNFQRVTETGFALLNRIKVLLFCTLAAFVLSLIIFIYNINTGLINGVNEDCKRICIICHFFLYIMYFKNVENVQDITYIQINEKKLK